MKKLLYKENSIYLILVILIVVQVAVITYCFAFLKKDVHSDEIWSYGPANCRSSSEFYADRTYHLRNFNEWKSSDVIKDYIMVQKGEQFQYDHIVPNAVNGLHQPLYFYMLHTICSFFPDTFSWWYGFVLNIIFFIIGQIFLFLLIRKITNNSFLAFISCFFYGFSQGAISCYVFIRMYAVMTSLGIVLCYLHACLIDNVKAMKKYLPIIWLVTIAGGMIHIFFLIFAGAISACFCFYYLLRREWKNLFIYAGIMLLAAGLVFSIFPQTLGHAQGYSAGMSGGGSEHHGFSMESRFLIAYMAKEMFGLYVSPFASYFGIHLIEMLLPIVIFTVPFSFIMRKEEWFRKAVCYARQHAKNRIREFFTTPYVMFFFMCIVIIIDFVVTASVARVFDMKAMATRYVFQIYPLIYVLVVGITYLIVTVFWSILTSIFRIKQNGFALKRGIVVAFVVAMNMFILINADKNFYFQYDDIDLYLNELPENANYIFTLHSSWLMDCVCDKFYNCDNYFVANYDALPLLQDELSQLESGEDIYFIMQIPSRRDIIPKEDDKEIISMDEDTPIQFGDVKDPLVQKFLQKYKTLFAKAGLLQEFTYVGGSEIFGRPVFVFKIR